MAELTEGEECRPEQQIGDDQHQSLKCAHLQFCLRPRGRVAINQSIE